MLKKYIYYLTILINVIIYKQTFAQQLNFKHFGIEDGMPQSGINTIIHDLEGNIWIGTSSGLTSYNGVTFTTYNKKNGLAENRVTTLYKTKYNKLIIGHAGGSVSLIDIVEKKVSILDFSILNINTSIKKIIVDEQDNIWIGTQGQGVFCYKPTASERNTHQYTTNGTIYKAGFAAYAFMFCNDLMLTKNGVLAATNNGILKLFLNNNTISSKALENLTLPENTNVTSMAYFQNNLYFGTNNSGIHSYDFIFKKKIQSFTTLDGLLENNISCLQATKNYLYVGTKNNGLNKYIPALANLKEPTLQFQSVTINSGLSSEHINCLDIDKEQNVWIGTVYKLNQYFDEQFEIYGRNQGLGNSIVWSIMPDKINNDLWIGTDGGLYQFKRNANSNNSIFIHTNPSININEVNHISAIYQDLKGDIWYSNFGKGIFKYNPSTKKTILENRINATEVYSITGDNNNNIWFGTNKNGVIYLNTTTDSITNYNINNGLGGNNVYQVYCDSKNNIWAAVLGGNLSVWNGSSWKQFGKKDGYDNNFTLSIYEDNTGKIWLGSYEKGLYSFTDNAFKIFTAKNLKTELIYSLQEDVNNNLWLGTNDGLDKINLTTNLYKHYNKYDGFLGVEINPNAMCKTQDNGIWMGTIIGLVHYQSAKTRNITLTPSLKLNTPRIFYEIVETPINSIYSYKQNHITFDFIGTNLTNPKDVLYEYYLEGIDDSWLPKTKNNTVTYPHLEPGTYTFHIRASSDNKNWSVIQLKKFTIKPPFYKTWLFYLFLSLASIFTIGLFIYIRTKNLRRANKILEHQVDYRTKQLKDERDNVSRQNIQINAQNNQLEKINTNITDSINYAKRIQETLFISLNEFENTLKNAFVFFKPKDIVSGDFYWLKEQNNKVLFTVGDCTGHGVPGAFMSIMGYNLLNEITAENTFDSPSKILTELKNRLQKSLSHHHNDEVLADGMDMAFCSLDFNTYELCYAGAFITMYIVRNNEIIEFKPNKTSIGKTFFDNGFTGFTEHKITLQKNDVIYISTDGYPDQMGMVDGKKTKFYIKNFKDLLLSINQKPIRIQVALLLDALEKFKIDEQTDDITVIGIKI